jgi:mannose-6-phosphate isomerase
MGFLEEADGQGENLKAFFDKNRSLFGDYQGDYPLLSKIITPEDYLSVQVHPNDEYAMKHHNSLGKPES